MSNVNSFTQVVDASGQLRLANGNFLYLIAASAAVTIQLQKGGTQEQFQNAIGGLQLGRVKVWDWAFFVAAPGTTLTFIYGITALREDVTILQQQIATVAGTVNTQTAPSVAIADTAPISPTVAGQHAIVPQNLLRRRVTIFSDPANAGDTVIYIRKTGGANTLGFITPGNYEEFDTTAGLDYQCTNGGDKLYILEES